MVDELLEECLACHRDFEMKTAPIEPEDWYCEICRELPDALRKACRDPFFYEAILVNGLRIHFCDAMVLVPGKWVRLFGQEVNNEEHPVTIMPSMPAPIGDEIKDKVGFPYYRRGVDVQIDKIVLVADAPQGS